MTFSDLPIFDYIVTLTIFPDASLSFACVRTMRNRGSLSGIVSLPGLIGTTTFTMNTTHSQQLRPLLDVDPVNTAVLNRHSRYSPCLNNCATYLASSITSLGSPPVLSTDVYALETRTNQVFLTLLSEGHAVLPVDLSLSLAFGTDLI